MCLAPKRARPVLAAMAFAYLAASQAFAFERSRPAELTPGHVTTA